MAIFRYRPLALTCCLLMAVVLAALVLPLIWGTILLGVALAAAILFFILSLKQKNSYGRFLAFLLALGALLGLGRVVGERIYTSHVFGDLDESEVRVVFTVKKVLSRGSFGSELLVRVNELDGNSCLGDAVLSTEDLSPLTLGDRGEGELLCTALDRLSSERRSICLAEGADALLTTAEESSFTLLESGNGGARAWLQDLRYMLHNGIARAVGGEAGELLGALLLGTRDGLSASTVRNFRRVGLSHLLAISGLHLAILTGVTDKMLFRFRVGKYIRIAVLSVFCLCYLFLSGFSFSILRSVIMLMMLHLAFILGGPYDGMTSLCFGGALILLISPGAIYDLSFQMTMLATFGILSFGEVQARVLRMIPKRHDAYERLLSPIRSVISTLFVTASATIAVLPIQWLTFGEISLMSPVSNIPMLFLATPLLGIGLFLLLLVAAGWSAAPIAALCRPLARAMLLITEGLADTDCVLSLRYGFVPFVLLPMLLATAILLVVELKEKLRYLVYAPTVIAILAFAICLGVTHHINEDRMYMTYHTTGSSDSILLMQNGKTLVCDLSNGSYSRLREEYAVLQMQGATKLDVLMLTHYHARQENAVAAFCDAALVRALWLPPPLDAEDALVLEKLLLAAEQREIEVTFYEYGHAATVLEKGSLTVSTPLTAGRSVEPAFCIDLTFGETAMRYESAAYSEYATEKGIAASASTFSHLILGGHGPRPHTEILLTQSEELREVWVSSDDVALCCPSQTGLRYVLLPGARTLIFS